MDIKDAISAVNGMRADGIIEQYAIGGAVGATFHLEPISTFDLDVFVTYRQDPGQLILSSKPLFDYLLARGATLDGEYVIIAGWPVQFLPPTGPLVEEAMREAIETDIDGEPTRVFSAEHLAAIALETGRAKDKARLLQFIEAGVLDAGRFESVVVRHGLAAKWRRFEEQFLRGE